MGVPFEALLPYGIMLVMFGVTGVGLAGTKYIENNGKPPRRSVDAWDRQSSSGIYSYLQSSADSQPVIERDYRLTGVFRGQTDNVKAPLGFDVNNPWKLEDRII